MLQGIVVAAAMHEAQDSDFSPPSSSIRQVLAVAGALVGLMLLVCGGVSGYVMLNAPPEAANQPAAEDKSTAAPGQDLTALMMREVLDVKEIPLTKDPASVREIAATIIEIDLPAGLEPIEAEQTRASRFAIFKNKTENGAILKLVKVQMPLSAQNNVKGPASVDLDLGRQALKVAENYQADITLRATRNKMKSMERELTVLGKTTVFKFKQGKRASNNQPVWKISGAFATEKGMDAMIYLVPEAEFDEEAIVRMIESMRPEQEEAPVADKTDADKTAADKK